MCLPSAIFSGVLSIIHPPLYNASHLAMQCLNDWAADHNSGMAVALSHWSTIFTNILLIVNRSTPLHRDPHSQSDWYDMLVSVGDYRDCGIAKWSLQSRVIAFCSLSGPHTGENITRYFIKLCERVGIVSAVSMKVRLIVILFSKLMVLQLFCLTADNASNNDSACDLIEEALQKRHIYTFDPTLHCLPCLAHVLNLAITNVMSAITKIASVETTMAIWEFNPSLPSSRILGNSLDVVAAI